MKERIVYAVDLDWTLCTWKPREWECRPIPHRIKLINDLYKKGHIILIYTARFPSYFQDTLAWLIKHWVYHHWINMRTKPWADVYIDDKAVNDKDFFWDKEIS
jgi:hypothetical protein